MSAATLARLAPLAVALPLLLAAVLVVAKSRVSRRAGIIASVLLAGGIMALFVLALAGPAWERAVTWLGGWTPRGGQVVGIALVTDVAAAEMVVLVAAIWTAAFTFGHDAMEDKDRLLVPLALVFLGAMCGLALAGDLFTLFVFYELMGVAAYALTAYKAETSALSGALIFAVANSVGAFLILIGLALVYARTGALNLAQLGRTLSASPADTLVLVAFALVMSGFLVKSAIAPFHIWLPATHSVAPAPVSVLFSGVMVELGLYGAARVYWTVFHAALAPHLHVVRTLLLALATLTVLVGAVGAVLQRHTKRMLAFSTVSHAGLAWLGFSLFTEMGSAGALIYMPGHGLIKGALFIGAGILLQLFASPDEITLRGRARGRWGLGLLFVVAGLALAGLPPFATYQGASAISASAGRLGLSWVAWVILVAEALTGGAVLRATGRVFFGFGRDPGAERFAPTETKEEERDGVQGWMTLLMIAPAWLLVVVALGLGLMPRLDHNALRAAAQFEDQAGYAATVLDGRAPDPGAYGAIADRVSVTPDEQTASVEFAAGAVLGAAVTAGWWLRRRRPRGERGGVGRAVVRAFESLHSGLPGDAVTWIAVGAAVFIAVVTGVV